jgi:hypothetical protein
LTTDYFDNLDNELLNKYKKIKNRNNYRYVLLPINWWSFKFHAISLSFDSPFKIIWNRCKLYVKVMIFDGLSNDNEIK